jgi:predicted nucleic-acid-binding Zn-ribbon protein
VVFSGGGNAMIEKCPFCGNTNQEEFEWVNTRRYWFYRIAYPLYAIHCMNCGTTGPQEDTILKAVDRWNKRAKETENE